METFTRTGLTFDVTDSGPADGPVVILLHGFPEDRHCWDGVIPALTAAGHRVLAPDQRGYSPGARPKGRQAYKVDELEADILALADAAGAERFDVVGHDWGAVVAWALAGHHPQRVRTLSALSVPHTQAFLGSMTHSTQALRSWYMLFFQVPAVPEALLARGGGKAMAVALARSGLADEAAARYSRRARTSSDMTGPLGWYRALPLSLRARLGAIEVPTLFVYGTADRFVSAAAARGCASWLSGPTASWSWPAPGTGCPRSTRPRSRRRCSTTWLRPRHPTAATCRAAAGCPDRRSLDPIRHRR